MRDSSIFYRSFYEAIKDLPAENQAELYTAIFEYSLNFNEVELKGISSTIFKLIKPQLEANNKKYENGKKGGKPPKENQDQTKTKPKKNQNETKEEANVNDNVNENENNNVNEKVNENNLKSTTFSFFKSLISLGADKDIANDWLKVRKTKKATNTETALDGFVRELNKTKLDINTVLKICVEKSWSGLNAKWVEDIPIEEKKQEDKVDWESFKKKLEANG